MFEIWPFLEIFDLEWPLMTSWHLLSESWRQERHFDILFTPFNEVRKMTLNDPKFDLKLELFGTEKISRF